MNNVDDLKDDPKPLYRIETTYRGSFYTRDVGGCISNHNISQEDIVGISVIHE